MILLAVEFCLPIYSLPVQQPQVQAVEFVLLIDSMLYQTSPETLWELRPQAHSSLHRSIPEGCRPQALHVVCAVVRVAIERAFGRYAHQWSHFQGTEVEVAYG